MWCGETLCILHSPHLIRPLQPKGTTPLIRPDFKCTQRVKILLNFLPQSLAHLTGKGSYGLFSSLCHLLKFHISICFSEATETFKAKQINDIFWLNLQNLFFFLFFFYQLENQDVYYHHKICSRVKPVFTEPPWNQLLYLEQTGDWFIQVILRKISYTGTLYKAWFIQVPIYLGFGLYRYQFIQGLVYTGTNLLSLPNNVWRLIVFAPFLFFFLLLLLFFFFLST